MTEKQARLVASGDLVQFSDGCKGTVTTVYRNPHYPSIGRANIRWEDGQEGEVDFRDFSEIDYIGGREE